MRFEFTAWITAWIQSILGQKDEEQDGVFFFKKVKQGEFITDSREINVIFNCRCKFRFPAFSYYELVESLFLIKNIFIWR